VRKRNGKKSGVYVLTEDEAQSSFEEENFLIFRDRLSLGPLMRREAAGGEEGGLISMHGAPRGAPTLMCASTGPVKSNIVQLMCASTGPVKSKILQQAKQLENTVWKALANRLSVLSMYGCHCGISSKVLIILSSACLACQQPDSFEADSLKQPMQHARVPLQHSTGCLDKWT
jgi:hypothetical protein